MKHVIPFAIALAVAFCTTTAHANGALALHTEAQLAQIDGLPSPAKALVVITGAISVCQTVRHARFISNR